MEPDLLFFRYAFPCTRVILERGEMDQQTYSKLAEMARNGKSPGFEELEKIYQEAFRIMRKRYGENYKTQQNIELYWRGGDHNRAIDEEEKYKDKTESFRNLCKVRKMIVVNKAPYLKDTTEWFIVRENERSEELVAWNPYNIGVKKGDVVNTHHNMIVEKLG